MGGIKSMLFVVGIVVAAVVLYFRSSLSTEQTTALKASPPVVEEKAPEPKAPATLPEPEAKPVVAALPQVVSEPEAAPESKGPDPAAIKHFKDIHAKKRLMAREVLRRCRDGKEKRPQICDHARHVMRTEARPPKKAAEK